jgi:hypothetical protein
VSGVGSGKCSLELGICPVLPKPGRVGEAGGLFHMAHGASCSGLGWPGSVFSDIGRLAPGEIKRFSFF